MGEKGLVRRNEKQRARIYEVSRPREWTQSQLAGDRTADGPLDRAGRVYPDL
jgi:hypothetical protein